MRTPVTPIQPLRIADIVRLHLGTPVAVATQVARPALGTSNAERELAWYFGFADAEMGRRSQARVHFEVSVTTIVGRFEELDDDDLERRVAASRAARVVERRIESLSRLHVGVLRTAYEAVAWPRAFLERYGVLAGLVVRLVEAAHGERSDDEHGRYLGQRVERWSADGEGGIELGDAFDRARLLYGDALASYDRARGGSDVPSIVPQGDR